MRKGLAIVVSDALIREDVRKHLFHRWFHAIQKSSQMRYKDFFELLYMMDEAAIVDDGSSLVLMTLKQEKVFENVVQVDH